jgi:hypothetical protein
MMEIVELASEHYQETAQLHERLLPWSFMAQSGPSFLVEFYRGLIESGVGFGYVALNEGRVVGFIMGTYDRHNLLKTVLMNNFTGISWSLIQLLMRDITKLKTIYDILKSEKKIVSQVDCPAAESLFVAVAPEVKKGMLFYKLMYELSRNFLDHEMTAYLGRVLNSNPIFQVFKRMPGFKVVKEATIYDLQWTFYIYDIKAGFEDFEKLAYNF